MSPSSIAFLTRLVGACSVSSTDPVLDTSNRASSDVVAQMLDDSGLTTSIHEVPELVEKYNVSAHVGPDMPGKGLLLAGHTDTVPCTPADWKTDPFVLSETDGKLYGLGSCDMKGFFAIIAEALDRIELSKLYAPLQVWATANEECGMDGASFAAANTPNCAYALVGEPTDLVPVYAHKGALAEQIICIGKSGHASNPAGGASAIDAMRQVMHALSSEMTKQNSQIVPQSEFTPPHATHNFGMIRGGDAFNRIADRAELWVDMRLMPGTSVVAARKNLRATACSAVADMSGITIEFADLVTGFEATKTDLDSPIVQAAAKLADAKPQTASYATEAPYYSATGMDVVIMGAGSIAVAHQPDEFVSIDQLDKMASIIVRLIEQFCMRKPN